MTDARSVLTVNVDSKEFDDFQKKFAKYHEQVQKLPGDWANVGKATEETNNATSSFLKHLTDASPVVLILGKHQGEVTRSARTSLSVFREIGSVTAKIATNVANTAFSLAKWLAFGGALGLATGFLGVDALASGATRARSESRLLGVTPGELKAARDVYGAGGYFDPDTVLSNIRASLLDPTKRGFLNVLGINGDKLKESPAQLLPEILERSVDIFKRGGKPLAEGLHVTDIFDLPTLAGLSSLSPDELHKQAGRFQGLSSSLNLDDRTLTAWQRLQQQFAVAGDQLEKVLIEKLVRLAPAIEKFSDSIVRAVESIADNPHIGKWIDELGGGIERAAKYLGSDEFSDDVNNFINYVGQLSDRIAKMLPDLEDLGEAIHKITHPGELTAAAGSNIADYIIDKQGEFQTYLEHHNIFQSPADRQRTLHDLEAKYKLPRNVLTALYGLESANDTLVHNVRSGTRGPFQFKDETAKDYGLKNPYDFLTSADAAARYLADTEDQFHTNDPYQLIASFHAGRAGLKKAIESAPGNYRAGLGPETNQELDRAQKYFPIPQVTNSSQNASPAPYVRIDINNATGGNAIVQSTQMSKQP